jgi:hypothetical protein
MTDRKWRIIESNDRKDFYKKIAAYEDLGYKLLPESFSSHDRVYYQILMLNENFK